ncbi:FHA domain-containing protein [Adlercreutzia sp. ZJ176]|uniref:FHA domain-containing protein n=2 Tax=unclassified Adlercreutzia TaxID=2636013 RepID=UPI001F151B66|nr:FHA domain-containing protein [Adlercreutzia sp. ZJ176]
MAYDDEGAMSIDYVPEGAITICPGCSAILDASVTKCTQCGRVLVDEPEPAASVPSASSAAGQVARQEQARVETPARAQAEMPKKALDQSAPPVRPLREQAEDEDEYQTLVLSEDYRSEDFSETTILVEQNLVSLFRKATGEMFVAEPPLVLGRGSEATCCMTGNSAISRKHAEIVSRDGKYYLSDLGSANKTKIGGVALSPHALVEIQDETEFSLGDEEFVFHVGEKWCLAAAQAASRA